MQEVQLVWKGKKKHSVTVGEQSIRLDSPVESGGENTGPSPKPLLLAAFAGCTAMDVVSILTKMQEDLQELKIDITAKVSEGTPAVYQSFHLVYMVKGNLDKIKVEKAVNLSLNKYCSVAAMFRHFAKITFEIKYL